MGDLLRERGVAEDCMIPGDRARSLAESFENSAGFLPPGEPVVLIGSDYPMDWEVGTAKKAVFPSVLSFPRRSSA